MATSLRPAWRADKALRRSGDFRHPELLTAGTSTAGAGDAIWRRSTEDTAMPSPAYPLLVYLHVALGSIALASFWTAGLSRKGSRVHRLAGKVYLPVMAALLAGTLPMAAIFSTRSPAFGAFLFHLVLITAFALWTICRAICDKSG